MPQTATTSVPLSRVLACAFATLALALVCVPYASSAEGDDVVPPSQPKNIRILSATTSSISITWTRSTDDVDVAGYGIYVGVMRIDRTLEPPYTFTGLTCGTTYNLAIDAYDAAGNRSHPVVFIASTAACKQPSPAPSPPAPSPSPTTDQVAPSAPSGLSATGAGHTGISLTWTSSHDDVGVAGYGVYTNGVLVTTTSATGITLNGLSCGTTYTFGVDAFDAAGNRSGLATIAVSQGICAGGSGSSSSTTTTTTTAATTTTTTTTNTTTTATTTSPSAPSPDLLPPSTPLALGITNAGTTTVALTWSASTDNVAVTGYGVYVNGVRIGSASSTSFTVAGLTCGTTYTFAVDAFDSAGNTSSKVGATGSTAACAATTSANIFVAPSGSDASPCTAAAPCNSFRRAYLLARPGQIVQVAGGSYGSQLIPFDAAKTSADRVTFRPAPGASVSIPLIDFGQDQFDIPGPHGVVVQDMSVTYLRAWNGSNDLVWQNVNGRHFDVLNASNVSVLGGSYGPCQAPRDDPSCTIRIAASSNVTVTGVSIHGITSTDLVNYHVDGVFIRGSNGVVIRNSKLWGNMITNIRIQDQPGYVDQNITLENNWLDASLQGDGASRRWDAVDVDNPVSGLVIRNNSFAEDAGLQLTGTFSAARAVGNLMRYGGDCVPGLTYNSNVYIPFSSFTRQTPCGNDVKVTTFGYVNPGGFDFHLAAESPAINAGDPNDCPADDIDGQSRGGRCDAGADQR